MARVEQVVVSSTTAQAVSGPDSATITVKNLGPDSCYYAVASTVSSGSNDGTLTSGSTISFFPSKFFISAGTSRLQVTTASPGEQIRQYDRDNGWAGLVAPLWPQTLSTVLLIASRAYFARFVPSRSMTITAMSFVTTVAATNDDAFDIGIFNGGLTTLLGSAGATAATLNATAGVKSITLPTPITLQPGIPYYAAFSAGAVGGTAATVAASATSGSNVTALMGAAVPIIPMTFQAAAHPLAAPATAAGGIISVPLLGLKES